MQRDFKQCFAQRACHNLSGGLRYEARSLAPSGSFRNRITLLAASGWFGGLKTQFVWGSSTWNCSEGFGGCHPAVSKGSKNIAGCVVWFVYGAAQHGSCWEGFAGFGGCHSATSTCNAKIVACVVSVFGWNSSARQLLGMVWWI